MKNRIDLENELIYLGLFDKAREIYTELGDQAVLSYIKSSHKLLSKVYHPDLNPDRKDKANNIQQRLNRVSQFISQIKDEDLIDLIRNGTRSVDGSKPKILIVEDETGLQDLFRRVLTMEGYDIRVAGDGESGFREYCRFKPNLILVDVVLPIISGLELVAKIREQNLRIKAIYMSGFFGIKGLKTELDAEIGKYAYPTLAKPFKISALLSAVTDYLNESETSHFYRGV